MGRGIIWGFGGEWGFSDLAPEDFWLGDGLDRGDGEFWD